MSQNANQSKHKQRGPTKTRVSRANQNMNNTNQPKHEQPEPFETQIKHKLKPKHHINISTLALVRVVFDSQQIISGFLYKFWFIVKQYHDYLILAIYESPS